MRESLRKYARQIEETKVYLKKLATPENIEAARIKYKSAKKELEEYKHSNPESWKEYSRLWEKFMGAVEKKEKQIAENMWMNHPAWLLESQRNEAAANYYRLFNAANKQRSSDDP